MPKHTLLTREEALRASDLIRERLGHDRHLKITAAALTKAQGEGEFVGYAATFDTEPDLQGDVIAPRAFTQSIADWRARNAWPVLLWNHEFDSPSKVLGVITDMTEDSRGLLVTGQLDLTHEPAEAVYRAMKAGRITSFSFAFAIIEEHKDGDVNVLDQLDVLDVTTTPTPANRNARLVSVKSEPKRINRKALEGLVALGKEMLRVAADDSKLWRGTWDDVISRGERVTEIDGINAQLDELAKPGPLRKAVDPAEVDRFVTEVGEELVQEALDRAEQAAWKGRMDVNAVLHPVPVRVDARMRPDR